MSRIGFDYHGQQCEVELTVHYGDAHDIEQVLLDGVPSDIDDQEFHDLVEQEVCTGGVF